MSIHDEQDDRDVSLMAYDQYLCMVHWTPRLSEEEILQLLQQIARGKVEQLKACPDSRVLAQAKEARDHLVVGLQRLVMCMAQRCHRGSGRMELLDLIQEGNIGLLKAKIPSDRSLSEGNEATLSFPSENGIVYPIPSEGLQVALEVE